VVLFVVAALSSAQPAAPGADPKAASARAAIESGDYGKAIALLQELIAAGSADAPLLIAEWEAGASRRQKERIAAGEERERAGRFREARAAYQDALALIASAEIPVASASFASRPEILARIGRLNDAEDRKRFDTEYGPARSGASCKKCKGGLKECDTCEGRGFTIRRKPYGRKIIEEKVTCGTCRGDKKVFCPACSGFEFEIPAFSERERKAIAKVFLTAASGDALAGSLRGGIQAIEDAVLRTEGPELRWLGSIDPRYSWSRAIRQVFPPLPLALDEETAALEDLWSRARRVPEARPNLLLGYACEFVRLTGELSPLRSPAAETISAPPDAADQAQSASAEELWAFPDSFRTSWITVRAVFDQVADDGAYRLSVRITGPAAGAIRFFAWKPAAEPVLSRFRRTDWEKRTVLTARGYPFDIETKLRGIERGRDIEISGRLLRDPASPGSNWFEIRRLEVGRPAEERRLAARIEHPVRITAAAVPLGRIAAILRKWFAAPLRIDGLDPDRAMTVTAMDAPLALAADAIAVALDAGLRLDTDGALAIVPGRPAERPAGFSEIEKALRAKAGAPVLAAALPDRAGGASAEPAGKDLLLARLTQGLTDAHARATELARLRFRDPAGAMREEIVRVLGEGTDGIRVQTREGAEIRLPALAILGRLPISAEEEAARRRAIFAAGEKRLDGVSAIEAAAGRIALLRFAAAHGLEDATRILDAIVPDPAVPAAVRITFPAGAQARITEAWQATREGGADPRAIQALTLHPLDAPLPGDPATLAKHAEEHLLAAHIERLAALPGLPEADPLLDRALRRAERALACIAAVKDPKADASRLARIRSDAESLRAAIRRDLQSE